MAFEALDNSTVSLISTWKDMEGTQPSSGLYTWQIHTADGGWQTPQVEAQLQVRPGALHPELYFRFVKSKLSILESQRFKQRLQKLEQRIEEYSGLGQEALSEECMKEYLVLSREAALYACGLRTFLEPSFIERFRWKLRGTTLLTTPLKNFTKPMPKKVVEKVRMCIQKRLFDDYVVLHLDGKAIKKTEKERIDEKKRDPIIFGRLQYSERYYFIADWIDEFDQLTLRDIIKALTLKKSQITMAKRLTLKRKGVVHG